MDSHTMDEKLLERILELLTEEEQETLARRMEPDEACYHYYRKKLEEKNHAPRTTGETVREITEELGTYTSLSKDFFTVLAEFVERAHLKDPEVYRAAGMHRNQWSRLKQKGKRTGKSFILKLCLVLKLDLFESNYLLALAGYTFVPDDKLDYAVATCIRREIYDPFQVDEVLCSLSLAPLFSEEGEQPKDTDAKRHQAGKHKKEDCEQKL